jgi:LysM repeat protein
MKNLAQLIVVALIAAIVMAATAPAHAAAPRVYIVRRGDTLSRIARQHGVSVSQLASANGLRTTSWVYVGQRLVIPSSAPAPGPSGASTYIVRRGDTLSRIAHQHGVSVSQLASANGLRTTSWVYVGQRLVIPGGGPAPSPAGSSTYVVRRGDTLHRIARAYGISVSQLAGANGLRATSWVYVGQRLVIPGDAPAPNAPKSGRWIDVNLSTQTLTAYEGSVSVFSAVVSTGLPNTPTVVGKFKIWTKLRYDDMSGPGYYLRDVPYVMYFYRGYGLHGTYWHNNFGRPMSHGCVNLRTSDAGVLFNWASVGTLVVTHY